MLWVVHVLSVFLVGSAAAAPIAAKRNLAVSILTAGVAEQPGRQDGTLILEIVQPQAGLADVLHCMLDIPGIVPRDGKEAPINSSLFFSCVSQRRPTPCCPVAWSARMVGP